MVAGYSDKTAASQGSKLTRNIHVRAQIEAFLAETAKKLAAAGLTVEVIVQKLITVEGIARLAGDLPIMVKCIELQGQTIGAFKNEQVVDVRIKVEYDARLEAEYHALARVRLEQAGAAGLGAAIDVEHEPVAMLAAPVVGPDKGDVSLEQPQEARQDCAGSTPTVASDVQVQAVEPQAVEPATPIVDDHAARRKRGCSAGQLRRRRNERMKELRKIERADRARAERAARLVRSDNGESVAQAPPLAAPERRSSESEGEAHNG